MACVRLCGGGGGGLGMPGQSTPPSYCVYTARMVCPPYLLPPRSRARIVCGFTLYTCPAHMCCTLPMAIPTYNQRPPYGCYRAMRILCDDGTMPTWTCNGVCSHRVLWWFRSSTRCTSSSSSTHIHDALPYTRPRLWYHLARTSFSCPSHMSTGRCAYHGKAPARTGLAMQRALLSAKCPAQ